ncbi:hypothetical protein [Marinobacter xestospongiae]|uniref:Uncharacterized protein n=1 Tax=Marinobacter xestospongiae TaxID=994319 RepID=A0ABU3W3X4_9GAMM|nr:hypothetical protein [Marinobacter xestospongiae]MDV2081247.1 hypothetical protein [Marinobacter xestospongiae]
MSAKTYFFAEGCLPDSIRANFTLLALWSFISSLGLFSAGFVMALTSRLRLAAFFFIAVFIFAYYWKFPGALFHNDFRYLYLLLPIAVMGWASAISYPKKVVRYISYAFGMITAASLIFSIPSGLKFYESEVETLSADNRKMAEWVAENVPESSVVMVHDAGQISRIGKHPLVDLVGLKTSYSVEVHKNTTFKLCEQVPFSISHIASHFKANYLVVTSDWNQIFGLTRSLEATGWRVERADSERGNSHYQVFRIHPL